MSEIHFESGSEERYGFTVRELLTLWQKLEELHKRVKKGDPDTFLGREQIEHQFKLRDEWKKNGWNYHKKAGCCGPKKLIAARVVQMVKPCRVI